MGFSEEARERLVECRHAPTKSACVCADFTESIAVCADGGFVLVVSAVRGVVLGLVLVQAVPLLCSDGLRFTVYGSGDREI